MLILGFFLTHFAHFAQIMLSKFYILMVAGVLHVMTFIAILDSKHNQRVINRDYTVENILLSVVKEC